MFEQPQNIREEYLYKFASAKRYLKIHVPGFAFKHDDNNEGKDRFVGRDIQFRRLYAWLTSDSKSGSYLITGYRGMGKSLLVKRVINMITREPKAYKEVLFQVAMLFTLAACYAKVLGGSWAVSVGLFVVSLFFVAVLELSKQWNHVLHEIHIRQFPLHQLFDKDMIAKVWIKLLDRRRRKYNTIAVTVNLGQEVLHERDVLSLITQSVREKYSKFVHNRQNRPITSFIGIGGLCIASFVLTSHVFYPILTNLCHVWMDSLDPRDSWFAATLYSLLKWAQGLMTTKNARVFALLATYLFFYYVLTHIVRSMRKYIPYFSQPFNALKRLDDLCDRISSTFNEEIGSHPQYSSSLFNFSFGKEGKSKSTPKATVRELEQELLGIMNDINSDDCPPDYSVQFIIIFDELDKITKAGPKPNQDQTTNGEAVPEFDTSVKGFTDAMAYEERKQNVLRLLANMKLFIASVKAKCVFISGHELFDASLADLSDREFAISSIFNGVLNVSSFLSPEHEQTDVSSMTEVYLANMLLPDDYLKRKIMENVRDNGVLKDELPSLRWYNEYLMELHVINNTYSRTKEETRERVLEIRHVMEFLRCFAVYLSHISNGSPKKIATYFEKYIKVNYDAIRQIDWRDVIVVGHPSEKDVRKQCVLFFNLESQKLINFVHYLASPVMNAISNEVSHYGDKLLVSSSFMLDQIYKYHGKGFSWRNLELMPELLNTNKNPELRDSMSSIMEFLLQTHISLISSGVFQYKFHKQISEEISNLSKTSEEAAAIFNFTLNESETVKRYNTRLLWHYVNLSQSLKDKHRYDGVIERIHENLGDIYFSEEDYYRAIHEYRSALQCMNAVELTPANLLPYLKCSLKVGMSYEYRRTFENAYMVYCQIINQLIHLQWFEEGDLGLDYTMRLTKDWRTKQAVLVDKDATKSVFGNYPNKAYRRQFQSGLVENIDGQIFKPQYSLNSDKTISGLSANYTPEKSDIFLKLTAFEDVKYIYQAIIAKLFVIEKMEVSGITQSSIDAAEAEFITLYSCTNYGEKFMLAVDYFSKLADILYYKNNFVAADPINNILSALYVFDINVMALLDDYCFKVLDENGEGNAITIKDDVKEYFNELKVNHVSEVSKFSDLVENVDIKCVLPKYEKKKRTAIRKNVKKYLTYLDGFGFENTDKLWKRLQECATRREKLDAIGHHLPCNACKYANRSLLILLDKMFNENLYTEAPEDSKAITLLLNTSHKHVRFLRREHLSALANSAEQLADIMLSCACTSVDTIKEDKAGIEDSINFETIELLKTLSETIVAEDKRKTVIKAYVDATRNQQGIGKLDRALLYYWSASRYYEIAAMYHESTHCIERIALVIEDYFSIISFKDKRGETMGEMGNDLNKNKDKIIKLLEHLFTHASRMVGHQYDNFDMAEIHEYKWLFHLEYTDNIDLTTLTQFPNLQSIFFSIVRSKLYLFQIIKSSKEARSYIKCIYTRIAPALRLERTFKSEVELNYTKAMINRIILFNLLGNDFMYQYRNSLSLENITRDEKMPKDRKKRIDYHTPFFKQMYSYLISDSQNNYESELFGLVGDVKSRLDLLDFLVFDSIVCLYNIIKALPPHNQITTFSNCFVADVYDNLWEWSKFYEMLYNLYSYYRCFIAKDEEGKKKIVTHMDRLASGSSEIGDFSDLLSKCAQAMLNSKVVGKDDFGYRYSKLFMSLRHEMDDATIHHIYTNYSAEMAVKYYRAARGINSEGMEYKNLINNMYVLDDDLRNDTCRSNLADERYLLNSGILNEKRKQMQTMYGDTNINKIDNYEIKEDNHDARSLSAQLSERFGDSLYTNTEY